MFSFLSGPGPLLYMGFPGVRTRGYQIFKIKNLNLIQVDSYVKLNFRQGLFSTKNPFEAI